MALRVRGAHFSALHDHAVTQVVHKRQEQETGNRPESKRLPMPQHAIRDVQHLRASATQQP
jgi:hypothetical protein